MVDKRLIILIILIILILSGIGILVYFLTKKNKSTLKYTPGIPQKFIDDFKNFYNSSKYPNLTEDDYILLINNRYSAPQKWTQAKCKADSTNFAKDCNFGRLNWSCTYEGRKDYINNLVTEGGYDGITPLKNESEDKRKQILTTLLKPEIYGISCTKFFPNDDKDSTGLQNQEDLSRVRYNNLTPFTVDNRQKLAKELYEANWNQNPKIDFNKYL
jgi:hypothetical protein